MLKIELKVKFRKLSDHSFTKRERDKSTIKQN